MNPKAKPILLFLLLSSSSLGFLFLHKEHGVVSSPVVTSVSPWYGFTDLNTNIEIAGSNFQSGATVKIGQTAATSVTVLNATTLTATVPYGSTAGTYEVTVTNPDGQSGVFAGGFEVVSPPNEWTKDTVNGLPSPTTSNCTILMPDNITYRTYFTGPGGILTYTSTDGKNWGNSTNTGITDIGGSNPSVIRLKDGNYLMIYGVQTAMPVTERLYRATSSNGITFTKQVGPLTGGAVLIADAGENDFVSVPDFVYLNDTTLRIYFVASTISSRIHSATSTDNGRTWTREGRISISGGPIGGQENDPDVVALSDGTWRLFFATPPVGQQIGNLRIRSALSTDGRNFILEPGSRVTPSGSVTVTMDPDVVLVPGTTDTYRMHYGVEPPGNLGSAASVPTLPSPPMLSSPSDNAANQSLQIRLTWFASNRAISYRLQVSTSPSFTTTLFSQSAINDTSYTISGLAYNTTYYWRVNASNTGGTGAYSFRQSFKTVVATPAAPTLATPSNGATGVSTSPTLSWNSSTGVTSYRLQVSADSGSTSLVYDQSGITGTSQQVSGLANNTLYYWRVSATNASGTSDWSTFWSFTTAGPTSVEQLGSDIPRTYALHQNYPNPFNPFTTIQFSIPKQSSVVLTIFNSLGMEIEVLLNEHLPAGHYRTQWTPRDIPSGVYFYQLRAGNFSDTKKLLLLR